MQGLRKPENKKFEKFFEHVQNEAAKRSCVFFLDCGQGDVFEDDLIMCEDMCGWMIPESMAEDFTPLFMNDSEGQHDFDDRYVFIGYSVNDGKIEIEIDDSPNDLIVEFNLANEVEYAEK